MIIREMYACVLPSKSSTSTSTSTLEMRSLKSLKAPGKTEFAKFINIVDFRGDDNYAIPRDNLF